MAIFNPEYAHWHQFFDGLSVSPADFYQSFLKGVQENKLPETQVTSIEFLERGLLSSKRMYLKIKRDWLTYHICAAPFGTGFFVSSRLLSTTWRSWPLLLIPLFVYPMLPFFLYIACNLLFKNAIVSFILACMSVPPILFF